MPSTISDYVGPARNDVSARASERSYRARAYFGQNAQNFSFAQRCRSRLGKQRSGRLGFGKKIRARPRYVSRSATFNRLGLERPVIAQAEIVRHRLSELREFLIVRLFCRRVC